MTYNISEAKNNIDRILDLAESGHPQIIKRGSREVAVIVSVEDWKRISESDRGIRSLTEKEAAGMTVNERLYLSGLLERFNIALAKKDKPAARAILEQIYLTPENIEAILLNEFK